MRRTHLGVQAAIVLTMVSLVSWPQFRPLRAESVWRYVPAAQRQTPTEELARVDTDRAQKPIIGVGRAGYVSGRTATTSRTPAPATNGIDDNSAPPPLEVTALGGNVNALIGVVRSSKLMPIPYARVVLRNIRTGQVEAQAIANNEGRFTFLDLNTSAYIVEFVGSNGAVVGTSEVVPVARGDYRQTVITTAALTATTVAAALGNNTSSTLPAMTTVASNDNVTRTSSSLSPQVSPNSPTAGGGR